jgi:hypothetical protein
MHAQFAKWYAAVDLANDPPTLEKRWKAANAVAKDATWGDVDTLVRTAFGLRAGKSDQTKRIRTILNKADDSFDVAGNDREYQLLCGAALVAQFDLATPIARASALAVTTTAFGGTRKEAVPIDLVGYAEEAITKQSEIVRDRKARHVLPDPPKLDFKDAVAKAKEGSWESVGAAFGLAADVVSKAFGTFITKSQTTVDGLTSQLAMQDEELEMLWWLVGNRSWDLECAFDSVPKQAAPFVLAAELAKLTRSIPGPTAVTSLLSRAGIGDDQTTVPTVINAAPSEWLRTLTEGRQPSPAIHPVHFGVDRRNETDETKEWVGGWAATAQVDAERRFTSIDIAKQAYRERLLLLLVKD